MHKIEFDDMDLPKGFVDDAFPPKEKPTMIRLGSGHLFDLFDPDSNLLDPVTDIAEPLGKAARFNGQAPGSPWSVCEHQTIGAAVIMLETGDPEKALAFGMHDAHEGPFGDIATPSASAIGAEIGVDVVRSAIARIKGRLDWAVATAMGTPTEYGEETWELVHKMDGRMFRAEQRQLWNMVTRDVDEPPTVVERVRASIITEPQAFMHALRPFRDNFGEPVDIVIGPMAPMSWRRASRAWLNCVTELKDQMGL